MAYDLVHGRLDTIQNISSNENLSIDLESDRNKSRGITESASKYVLLK